MQRCDCESEACERVAGHAPGACQAGLAQRYRVFGFQQWLCDGCARRSGLLDSPSDRQS